MAIKGVYVNGELKEEKQLELPFKGEIKQEVKQNEKKEKKGKKK